MSYQETLIIQRPDETVFVDSEEYLISHGEQGLRGPTGKGEKGDKGDPGPAAFVSADPNNMTREGTDGGIYTPDIVADPVAYYILAKS